MLEKAKKTFKLSTMLSFARSEYSIFFVLLAMIIIASIISPVFLTARNLTNIIRQMAVLTVMAYGQTIVIASGMIDLSVGSVMALAGVFSVYAFVTTESLIVAVLVAILTGVITGSINGFVTTKLKVPSFITTLGMLTAARGVALLFTGGQNIYNIGVYREFARAEIFGIPSPVFYMVGGALVAWYIFKHRPLGRYIYAVGGNETAAEAAGIKVEKVKFYACIIGGIFAALAGVIYMSRVSAGLPNAGQGFELDVISISVIGGTSITGGTGTAAGTLAGGLIIGVLNNILNLLGVGSYMQQVIRAIVIVVAVAYDTLVKSRS